MTLSQAVLASYEVKESDGFHLGQLTVTGISPCDYGTYVNYKHLDPQKSSAVGNLNMRNGHWQEMEVVENLRHAGYQLRHTGADQLVLHIGKSKVPGRPDGLITVNGREDVLSVKAMNLHRFTEFSLRAFEAEPLIRCQEQMYLASDELAGQYKGTWVYAKHKDTCKPFDLFEQVDTSYSKPIIQATDEIILGGYIPKPLKNPLCIKCRHKNFCWSKDELPIDMSKVKVVDIPEIVDKWKKGKFYKDYGSMLVDEARKVLIEQLGEDERMYAEDLKVQRTTQHRQTFNRAKFAQLYGADNLSRVMDDMPVSQVRISEVD